MNYSYRVNVYALVEGNNSIGWVVINMVTGLAGETTYPTFAAARAAADHLKRHYRAFDS